MSVSRSMVAHICEGILSLLNHYNMTYKARNILIPRTYQEDRVAHKPSKRPPRKPTGPGHGPGPGPGPPGGPGGSHPGPGPGPGPDHPGPGPPGPPGGLIPKPKPLCYVTFVRCSDLELLNQQQSLDSLSSKTKANDLTVVRTDGK